MQGHGRNACKDCDAFFRTDSQMLGMVLETKWPNRELFALDSAKLRFRRSVSVHAAPG